MKLHNHAEPILWTAKTGGYPSDPPYVGKVIAKLTDNTYHPYVVWSMSSQNGDEWHCIQGDYCETLADARAIFSERRI